jgi:hypothetical protein
MFFNCLIAEAVNLITADSIPANTPCIACKYKYMVFAQMEKSSEKR